MNFRQIRARQSVAAIFAVAFAAAFIAAASLLSGPTQSSADTSLDSEEQAFITLLNQHRTANSLGPLLIDPGLQGAAEWMNNDMGVNRRFDHIDSLGQSPWTRMCNFGYCYNTWKGENIAAGYTTGADVFTAWRNSSGHNANMLGLNFRVMGLSRLYVAGSPYGYYWTNDFGGYIAPGAYSPPSGPTNTPAVATASPSPTPTPSPSPTPSVPPIVAPTASASPSPVPTAAPTTPPTAAPTASAAPGCQNDTDCDGWTDAAETYNGTDPTRACAATGVANDELIDASPFDTNDDRLVSMVDLTKMGASMNTIAGINPNFDARFDINADGKVTVSDALAVAPVFNTRCS